MATTSNNSGRRTVLRVAGLAAGGALAGLMTQFAAAPPAAADVVTETGSVTLTSTSSTQSVVLDQFDPAAGSLNQVTVTVAVEANANVEVTNLTATAKATTVTLEVTASGAGPGVSGVTAAAIDTASANLGPNGSLAFSVDAAADEEQAVTDVAGLGGFVGTGTVSFALTGLVGVDVEGPATWRGRGAMTATATVTVAYDFTPSAPPTAVADTVTVFEDDPAATVDVLANDTDSDGGPITVASASDPANGTVAITNSGADLSYQPDLNYCNDPPGITADTFSYTLNGGSSATVSVTVTCVPDAPTAVADSATVTEDDPTTTIDVLVNDADPEGDTFIVDSVTPPANGTVVVTNGGADLTYEPNPDYCNSQIGGSPDTLTYTLDPGGSTATVSVTVTCVDDAPTAVDDPVTVLEDAAATTVGVLANDTDVDGGPITIDTVTQPANGTVVITNDGDDLTYLPNPNYCSTAPDTFAYTLDPGGSTATVSVTVTCVDDPPTAVDDTTTLLEDATATIVDVLVNDPDPDGGPKTIDTVTQPGNGTVVIAGSGTGLTYQPDLNYCNDPPGTTPDTFTYTLNGGSSATVSVTVTCEPDAPTAVVDSATVAEDSGATTVDVLANDVDPEGDPFTVGSVTQPVNGTVVITSGGADLTYEPDADYCNSQAGGSPDTFGYTLAPGGSTATVSVAVTCVDDAPVAVDDTVTVAEDSGATAVDVLVNDTDVDGGPITVDTVTQPANGTVVITNDGDDLTYVPDPDYCNTPPGTTLDTFTYTLNGGSTATVSVTVTCVDDPPTAVADTATVIEDDPATTIDVLANDTDPDGGPITVDAVTQPANGTVAITNAGDDLTYQPNLNYCNSQTGGSPDTFSYTLNGGSIATVSVTVTCVTEDPVAVGDSATVAEDSAATTIDVLANDVDADSVGMTIDAVTQPANGTVTITNGGDDLTYQPDPDYCNTPPGTTLDTFSYTLDPGGSTATVSVTVTCVDDAPTAVDDSASVAEDSAATMLDVLANDTDPDGGPITVDVVTQPANGTVVITNAGADLTYQPNPNYCNDPPGTTPDTFTYTLDPGTSTATVSVTVSCVNDAPTITLSGSTPTFTEGGPAATVDDGLTVTDIDDTNLVSGTVSITAGLVTGDTLTFSPAGGITDTNPASGVLALDGTTTIANWQTVLRSVQFSSSSDNPTAATRTVSFTVNDGDAPSNTAPKSVTVVPVNDAPVLTQPDSAPLGYTEGAAATVIAPNITASDVDSTDLVSATIVIGAGYANGQDVLSLGTNPQNDITAAFDPATGTLTLTGASSVANYQTALRDVRFANTSQDPTAGTRTVSFQVDDGPAPNDLSNIVSRGVTVTPVNDAPDAVNDSFTGASAALANTRLAVGTTTTGPHLATPGSVLSNDTDVDSPTSGFTAGPATISSTNCTGCDNVTLEADGNFTYDPPADFVGTDTFTYTVNDNDPQAPANQTDTATVSIEVVGPVVWYVDIDAAAPPAGQGGRSHSPFNSLAPLTTGGAADGLDGDGDIIFVGVDTAPATGPYEGGLVLEANQKLWGEPFGLNVDPNGPIPATQLVAATPATPVAGNPNIRNNAVGGVGITLANGVDIQRVNAGVTGTASTTAGISGTAITTATIGANQLVQGNATGVTLTGAAGGNITVGATITGNSATAVNVANRSSGTVTFNGDISGTAGNTAVILTGNTGATVALTGPINLAGSGAAISKFSATGGGTITATNATNQITGFSGTGINLNGVNIGAAGVTFNTVTTAPAGAVNGVTLTNVAGPGAFIVNSGSITAATRALDVDDNTANITIGATLTTSGAAARSVEVTNRDGGTVDLNGLVTDTSQGINLSTNGTGLVRFDGGINASTGANTAFNATGGGTVTATQNNTTILNALTTTTGTALNVQNTTIHTDDLTFRGISANGAPNGIVLTNTGTAGNLTVTGGGSTAQGGDNSGGTIQSTTGFGISLTNTTGPSFRNMRLLNTGDSGVNGTQVSGFSFTDGTIAGAGDASDENSITFDDSLTTTPNLAGVVTITNNVISQTEAEGIDIINFAGTISNANVSNNALSDTGDVATPGSAVTLIGFGTPTTAGSITRATVANNTITDFRAGAGIQVRAGNVNAGGPAGHAGIAGSATDVIAITGNLMNGGSGGIGNQPDRFFTGGAAGIGQGNFNISNNGTATNRVRNIDCIAIELQADGPVTMTSTVQNNFINANSAVGCAGIAVGTDDPSNLGPGTHTTLISGNNVMGTDGPGIFPIIRDSGSTMTARVLNNIVAAPIATNAARAGIRVDSGSAEGDTTLCLEISGNTTAGSTNTGTATTSPGINLRKQGTDPAVNTFGIEGLAPSPTGTPNVENHVNGLNTSTSGTFGVGGTALLSAQTGFTSCVAP